MSSDIKCFCKCVYFYFSFLFSYFFIIYLFIYLLFIFLFFFVDERKDNGFIEFVSTLHGDFLHELVIF